MKPSTAPTKTKSKNKIDDLQDWFDELREKGKKSLRKIEVLQ